MWYVNNGDTLAEDIVKDRFILTMWYVNYGTPKLYEGKVTRFILTMWYANSLNMKTSNKNTTILTIILYSIFRLRIIVIIIEIIKFVVYLLIYTL